MLSFSNFIVEINRVKLFSSDDEIGAIVTNIDKKPEKFSRLPLSNITSRHEGDGKSSTENGESRNIINSLKQHLKQGKSLPPVLVRRHPKTNGYQIIDGHHRYHAHKELGLKHIDTEIIPGNRITGDNYN